jgi:heme/copper-type cytochrome/quinol oxidase subunit 2
VVREGVAREGEAGGYPTATRGRPDGCAVKQSTLTPESHPAREIAHLWWVMFAGSCVVLAVILVLLAIAVLRRRTATRRSPGSGFVLAAGVVVPVLVLSALFGLAVHTLPATSAPRGKTALTIDVVGHQFFWEVRSRARVPSPRASSTSRPECRSASASAPPTSSTASGRRRSTGRST